MCSMRKHARPLNPVSPQTPATHPDAMPMNDLILSIFRKLDLYAFMSNTSWLPSPPAASISGPAGAAGSMFAMGSIMVAADDVLISKDHCYSARCVLVVVLSTIMGQSGRCVWLQFNGNEDGRWLAN
mmetsp:Transcript_42188/g.72061  ORF Transcript_42188/g.72061 Transcript_42188/m.72061 type:complete len:127 (+) Transcript_42188:566-946(+)